MAELAERAEMYPVLYPGRGTGTTFRHPKPGQMILSLSEEEREVLRNLTSEHVRTIRYPRFDIGKKQCR